MLSNKDIFRELGKNIAVYPFNILNIKGASINLTASNMAWSVDTKKTIVSKDNSVKPKDESKDSKDKYIITIPPHDTGLIETNEVLGVSLKIGGTYHSRVKDVSKGLGHIGTTLNPGWVGRSLIALHNATNKPIKINVNAPIVTICFYYLYSKSTIGEVRESARKDILQEYKLNGEDWKKIYGEDYSKNFKLLKYKMLKDKDYIKYKKERFKKAKNFALIAGSVLLFLGLIICMCFAYKHGKTYDILRCILTGFFGISAIMISLKLGTKYIKINKE